MKILGLISGTEGYGVRRAWLGLSDQFRQKNVDLCFASVNYGSLATELQKKDFDIDILLNHELKNIKSGKMKIFYLIYRVFLQLILIPKLIKSIKQKKVDIVIFRSPMEVLLIGIVSKLIGIKSYWLMPNSVSSDYPFDFNRKIYRFIFKHCNVTPIANSKYTLSTLGKISNGTYTHLGIDPNLFIYSEEISKLYRSKLNVKDNDIIIGIFARMTPEKGQLMMIEAIHSLGEKASAVHLLLCGAGTDSIYQQEIDDKIKEYNLCHRVHLVGAVNNVVDYYSACDIVANTRLDAEPFGFSIIEAMMMGIPVLAHKFGGPGETVIDGLTGWHIQEPNLSSFCQTLDRVITDRENWEYFGNESKSRALDLYTSEKMCQRILEIIEKRI